MKLSRHCDNGRSAGIPAAAIEAVQVLLPLIYANVLAYVFTGSSRHVHHLCAGCPSDCVALLNLWFRPEVFKRFLRSEELFQNCCCVTLWRLSPASMSQVLYMGICNLRLWVLLMWNTILLDNNVTYNNTTTRTTTFTY